MFAIKLCHMLALVRLNNACIRRCTLIPHNLFPNLCYKTWSKPLYVGTNVPYDHVHVHTVKLTQTHSCSQGAADEGRASEAGISQQEAREQQQEQQQTEAADIKVEEEIVDGAEGGDAQPGTKERGKDAKEEEGGGPSRMEGVE